MLDNVIHTTKMTTVDNIIRHYIILRISYNIALENHILVDNPDRWHILIKLWHSGSKWSQMNGVWLKRRKLSLSCNSAIEEVAVRPNMMADLPI